MSDRLRNIQEQHPRRGRYTHGPTCDTCFLLDLLFELAPKLTVKPRKCVCCGGLTASVTELCYRCALEGYEAQRLELG